MPGLGGPKGLLGDRGEDGNFLMLLINFSFLIGFEGAEGYQGRPGEPGYAGNPGPPGRSAPSRGYFFTRHSQSTEVPDCPSDRTSLMWSGYSLLFIMGNERFIFQQIIINSKLICLL